MKKLTYIISVLVFALILSFTPACGKAVPAPEELLEVCEQGNLEEIERLLAQGADVNAKDNGGWTALMWVASYGHTETAEMLIDNGADVNAIDNYGRTALIIATSYGYTEIIDLLKEKGATE